MVVVACLDKDLVWVLTRLDSDAGQILQLVACIHGH